MKFQSRKQLFDVHVTDKFNHLTSPSPSSYAHIPKTDTSLIRRIQASSSGSAGISDQYPEHATTTSSALELHSRHPHRNGRPPPLFPLQHMPHQCSQVHMPTVLCPNMFVAMFPPPQALVRMQRHSRSHSLQTQVTISDPSRD